MSKSKKREIILFSVLIILTIVFFLSINYSNAKESDYTGKAIYDTLTAEQKQAYWDCFKTNKCSELLTAKKNKEYRECSLSCNKQAKTTTNNAWCEDSDKGDNFFEKGVVKSNIYFSGKEDSCYTFSNGKNYLFEGRCKNNKYQYVQKNCAEIGEDYVCKEGACIKLNIPIPPKYPMTDTESLINPIELSGENIKVIVPEGYEAYGQKMLEDLQYCFELVPTFLGIKPYWDGLNFKVFINKFGKNYGSYSSDGLLVYSRSLENLDSDLNDVITNDSEGFLYLSNSDYCANSHEFTHFVVDKTPIPLWANEGIAEYTQKTTQKGSKDFFECKENGHYGQDTWGDSGGNVLFPYSDLSANIGKEFGAGGKYYRTALCFWELFDNEFGEEKRKEAFQILRNQYTAEDNEDQNYQLVNGTVIFIPNKTTFFIENILSNVVGKDKLKPLLDKFGFEEGIDYK